jgi:iron(III) transport system substrate-binding protein
MAALATLWGEHTMHWWAEQLRNNGLRLVDGNSTVVRMIAKGEVDVGLTDTDDVWAAQREGWPVAFNYAEHRGSFADRAASGSVLTIPNAVALVKGGPHPENAEKLAAFLLSERVERMLAESDSHNVPIRPALAAEFSDYAVPDPLDVPYDEIADHMDDAMRVCDEVLR